MKALLKHRVLTAAILLPLVLVARYALFEDASEFQLFFEELKRYVAPLAIMLALILIVGLVGAIATKTDKRRQEKLAYVFFWFSSVVLVVALIAVFANTKIQNRQSVQSSKSDVIL